MPAVALVIAAFLIMEPVTALLHRYLFHGPGIVFHRSHHVPSGKNLEANDTFPIMLALLTIGVMALGSKVESLRPLLWIGAGLTLYGTAYTFVHDLYIHRRVAILPAHIKLLEPLREAHRIHHLYGGAPYGMLLPTVPKDLRTRSARTRRDPLLDQAAQRLLRAQRM